MIILTFFTVTSEPPLCLSFSVPMALREAVASARSDAGDDSYFHMSKFFSYNDFHFFSRKDY